MAYKLPKIRAKSWLYSFFVCKFVFDCDLSNFLGAPPRLSFVPHPLGQPNKGLFWLKIKKGVAAVCNQRGFGSINNEGEGRDLDKQTGVERTPNETGSLNLLQFFSRPFLDG